ncbi:MAG: PDDEXK nuclease domain-containing protein [Thermoguttaceae bacterium]
MNTSLDFQQLVVLCQRTDEEMRSRAARAVDTHLVVRNFLFGLYIVQFEQEGTDRAAYGAGLVDLLTTRLKKLGIKGISPTYLRLYRTFYREFQLSFPIQQTPSVEFAESQVTPNSEALFRNLGEQTAIASLVTIQPTPSVELVQALSRRFTLGWSHYVELLTIDSPDERRFYEIEAAANQWSVRELRRQIDSSLYQRLALSRDKDEVRRLATEGQVVEKAADIIKNPLVLEFLGLEDRPHYSEDDLESAIIDRLETFLLELGKGFLFEARQKRFTFDNDHFFVDLVFYNRLLRCYVLIDLKRTKLTHQDLGQMQMYVNYFDRFVKLPDELSTIGIVLCPRKNDALVELTLPQDANIFASKYQLYLPSKEELKAELETIANEVIR